MSESLLQCDTQGATAWACCWTLKSTTIAITRKLCKLVPLDMQTLHVVSPISVVCMLPISARARLSEIMLTPPMKRVSVARSGELTWDAVALCRLWPAH